MRQDDPDRKAFGSRAEQPGCPLIFFHLPPVISLSVILLCVIPMFFVLPVVTGGGPDPPASVLQIPFPDTAVQEQAVDQTDQAAAQGETGKIRAFGRDQTAAPVHQGADHKTGKRPEKVTAEGDRQAGQSDLCDLGEGDPDKG